MNARPGTAAMRNVLLILVGCVFAASPLRAQSQNVCPDGTLWNAQLGGVYFTSYQGPGDPPFTDKWSSDVAPSYVHSFTPPPAITSASLTVRLAGVADNRGPWDVLVNNVVIGQIPVNASLNADQEVRTYTWLIPTGLVTGVQSIILNINVPTINDGYSIDYSELTIQGASRVVSLVGDKDCFGLTQLSVPGPPTNVSAVRGNAQATVSFTAPASNGGAAITSYTVTASPGGATTSGPGSPLTVPGLTNGTAYTFTVVATNSVGSSVPSTPSNSVTPATVPGPPTNVSAVGGNAQATVSFTAPASNGGAPITSYTVTASPGGATSERARQSADGDGADQRHGLHVHGGRHQQRRLQRAEQPVELGDAGDGPRAADERERRRGQRPGDGELHRPGEQRRRGDYQLHRHGQSGRRDDERARQSADGDGADQRHGLHVHGGRHQQRRLQRAEHPVELGDAGDGPRAADERERRRGQRPGDGQLHRPGEQWRRADYQLHRHGQSGRRDDERAQQSADGDGADQRHGLHVHGGRHQQRRLQRAERPVELGDAGDGPRAADERESPSGATPRRRSASPPRRATAARRLPATPSRPVRAARRRAGPAVR